MAGENEGEVLEPNLDERFQRMFLNTQRIIAKLYEDKNTRDATLSSKGTKVKKGKEKTKEFSFSLMSQAAMYFLQNMGRCG